MDIYTLSKIAPTIDGYGFNIIGMQGRPLVYFAYSHEKEASRPPNTFALLSPKRS
jgi:hypothetical protein